MLLISLAAVLAVLTPQAEPDIDALLAPAMTPNQIAAFCFTPANRQPGERDRDCQHRLLREDPVRVARIDDLRRRCDRLPLSPGVTTDACVRQILTDETAAAEAARLERAAALERARTGQATFDDLFTLEAAPATVPPSPPPPARREPGCRRETTRNPDGAGGSVIWVCGDDDGVADQLREALRPRTEP